MRRVRGFDHLVSSTVSRTVSIVHPGPVRNTKLSTRFWLMAALSSIKNTVGFSVLIGFIAAGKDAPSQKEISDVPVRLLLRRDVETIQRHLPHAC